ncbi:hypothetical protein EDC01DRAFT_665668 [Geopyxis carbonaria]|nr:hypothetical protein EDC01DRAFT_665668 [Geopyxis carbonaria]
MRLRLGQIDTLHRCLYPRLIRRIPLNESSLKLIASNARRCLSSSQSSLSDRTGRLIPLDASEIPVTLTPLESVRKTAHRHQNPFKIANYLVQTGALKRSVELYEILIWSCARAPQDTLLELAFKLLQEMKDYELKPSSDIYHNLLKLLSKSPDYIRREQVLQEMNARWFQLKPEGERWVIMGYIFDTQLEMALHKVRCFKEKNPDVDLDTGVYRSLARGLIEMGEVEEAHDILKTVFMQNNTMFWEGQEVGGADAEIWKRLWYDLLETSSRELHHEVTKQAWYEAIGEGITDPLFVPSEGLRLQVLYTAARHGDVALAESVLQVHDAELSERKEYHYAALIEAYARNNQIAQIFATLTAMRQAGVPPLYTTASTAVPIIAASAESAASALAMLSSHPPGNLPAVDLEAVHLVMSAYVQRDDIETAFDVYKRLPELVSEGRPNTDTFNILLQGCARLKQKDLALYIASEMKESSQKPDGSTYEFLILVCLADKETSYHDAFIYLEEMKLDGFVLGRETYKDLALRCSIEGDTEASNYLLDEMDALGYATKEIRRFLRKYE